MKNSFYILLFFVCALLLPLGTQAQLYVENGYTAEEMVNDFFSGSCLSISNVTYTGNDSTAFGFFDGSASSVGLNAGILLTSGSLFSALGPNDSPSASTVLNVPGDADLDTAIAPYVTYDAAVLEFDIVPSVDTVFFRYVFGSEEYLEYVNSNFNDVFGFFISGPGYPTPTNIATLPDGLPVAINNVNEQLNSSYYINNGDGSTPDNPTTLQYDGFTVPMTCFAPVQVGATYHVKIAIADAGDSVLDSGIFLSIESLCGDGQLIPTFDPEAQPVFGMANTVQFEGNVQYATAVHWNFGDGAISLERNPMHTYEQPGTYTVVYQATNFMGTFTETFTVTVGTDVGVANVSTENIAQVLQQNSQVQVSLKETGKTALLQVFDLSGHTMTNQTLVDQAQIDMSKWVPGCYLFALTLSSGERMTYKVVR